jgi:hypothetical protein
MHSTTLQRKTPKMSTHNGVTFPRSSGRATRLGLREPYFRHCHTREFKGFLLPCKQVHQGYQAKARRSRKGVLGAVASGWSSIYHIPIQFTPVVTIAAQQRMSALLLRSRYSGAEDFEYFSPGLPSYLEAIKWRNIVYQVAVMETHDQNRLRSCHKKSLQARYR